MTVTRSPPFHHKVCSASIRCSYFHGNVSRHICATFPLVFDMFFLPSLHFHRFMCPRTYFSPQASLVSVAQKWALSCVASQKSLEGDRETHSCGISSCDWSVYSPILSLPTAITFIVELNSHYLSVATYVAYIRPGLLHHILQLFFMFLALSQVWWRFLWQMYNA
jgi:hypothetical protein